MLLEREIVEHGAPTLAGLKTGNLFPLKNNGGSLAPEIRRVNRMLSEKGVRLIPLRRSEKTTLVYLYRPDRLRSDLCHQEAESILCGKGYPCGDPDRCIAELKRHLCADEAFPHEIGLFLGYPPSDVKCFMKNPWEGLKCTGCWKVYGNQEEAEAVFARYKKCTDVYREAYNNGQSLTRLTVDCRGWKLSETVSTSVSGKELN